MRTHEFSPDIIIPDALSQIRALNYNGRMALTDETDIYAGAIYLSPALRDLSLKFTYAALGHDSLVKGLDFCERGPIAEYRDGVVGLIRQADFYPDRDLEITDLDDDLIMYEPVWREMFETFAFEVASCLGSRFELRLKCLRYDSEYFHKDGEFIIAIQPLGEGRDSTICVGQKGIIRPNSGELVITTPELEHSWPVSRIPRLGLGATVYGHHLG